MTAYFEVAFLQYFIPSYCKKCGFRSDCFKLSQLILRTTFFIHTGLHSAVDNVSGFRCVSDCISRGPKFYPGPFSYFCGG